MKTAEEWVAETVAWMLGGDEVVRPDWVKLTQSIQRDALEAAAKICDRNADIGFEEAAKRIRNMKPNP